MFSQPPQSVAAVVATLEAYLVVVEVMAQLQALARAALREIARHRFQKRFGSAPRTSGTLRLAL